MAVSCVYYDLVMNSKWGRYSEEWIDADTLDYHYNIDLLQDLKAVGTQLYPGFPLHRLEETSMILRLIVYGAWWQ